jgi:hypothetical protein
LASWEANTVQIDPISMLHHRPHDLVKMVEDCLSFQILINYGHAIVHEMSDHIIVVPMACLQMKEPCVFVPVLEERET